MTGFLIGVLVVLVVGAGLFIWFGKMKKDKETTTTPK